MDRRAVWAITAGASAGLACFPVLLALALDRGIFDVGQDWLEFWASTMWLIGMGLGIVARPRWLAPATVALTAAIWFLALTATTPVCSEPCDGEWRQNVLTVSRMFWEPLVVGAIFGGLGAYAMDHVQRKREAGVRRPWLGTVVTVVIVVGGALVLTTVVVLLFG